MSSSGLTIRVEQASVNRGKIASGFASALADIGTEMTYWRDQLAAFRSKSSVASTSGLTKIAAQLYTKVFRFMIPYLKREQSSWQRLKGSLDKTYYENNVQHPLEDILKFSNHLKREAGVQDTRVLLHTEDLAEDGVAVGYANLTVNKENLERTKNLEKMMEKRLQVNRFEDITPSEARSLFGQLSRLWEVGEWGQKMLIANTEETRYHQKIGGKQDSDSSRTDFEIGPPLAKRETDVLPKMSKDHTFASIEEHARGRGTLYTGFSDEAIPNYEQTAGKVFDSLQVWLSASESRTLWIYGPSNTAIPSDLSSASAFIFSMISRAKIPLIAHRCQPEDSAMTSLISMTYSLILQLVWLLPDEFCADKQFDAGRFALLDRSIRTLPDALVLMEDLLAMGPQVLMCILDGIQMSDDDCDDQEGTGIFLNFFLEILKHSKEGRILKLLFTTDGYCHRLRQQLNLDEQVDVMNEAQTPSGSKRVGKVSMADLTISEGSD